MTTKHNSQDNLQDFWDTSDTVFENYDEQNLLDQLNGSDVTLRTDKYNGFDNNSGDSWIYPTNYPVRKYQHDIVYNALFKNTLVVLPTGLGKTFIAAVVMYNFYRWYPQGKVIFMAPTRPLVAQQMNACYQIMGISKEDTADITGQQKKELRIQRWKLQRVFYATPQSVVSDLDDINFPTQNVKLIVVDEAHKAKGRHAYCEVIRLISAKNKMFRVLALSATPGRKTDDVAEVVHNLLISHIEIRTEKCSDVAPYTHTKQIETIVVQLNDKLRQYRNELLDIIDPYVRSLIDFDVITGTLNNLNKGWLMFQKQKYESSTLVQRHPHHSAVQTNFACCICLYHALELLERHGLWPFINYFNSSDEKFVVAKDHRLKQFLNTVRQNMGSFPVAENTLAVADADTPVIPVNFDFGHPKYDELQKCLIKHLSNTVRSQAIVFCEFRDSAFLIHQSLLRKQPMIKPAIFIGQGSTTHLKGITQKQQIATMDDFRQGIYNVLIATCVAEEGIDCGEVDLIICFDVSSKNPIRLVQRMGRTGRKRNGKVIMLVSEGKEQKNLTDTLAGKDSTNKRILSNPDVLNSLCLSPRLIPTEFDPKCVETFIKSDEISEVKAKAAIPRKSKTTNNEEQIPPEMTSIKSSKKQQPSASTNLRNFFQTIKIDGESQANSIRKEDPIGSHRSSQVPIVKANDNLKIPTFWEVIRNSTTPSALMTFAVKRNVNIWKDKFQTNSLSDVEMSAISKVFSDPRNIHVLGGEDSLYNNNKMPIMSELDDRTEKHDPLFTMKLTDRLIQIKRALKMQECQEKAVCIQERNSDAIDVSVHNETDEELTNLQMSYEVDSKYETPKRLKQLTLLNYSSPLKRKQTPLQSSTPLPTTKKQMVKRNSSVVDSPLKRAFERSFNKSLKEKKRKTSNVFEFFGFTDILDVFDDGPIPETVNTLPEPEKSVDFVGNTLHSSENEKPNEDICTRTPLAVISNQDPQEYTVSQILKIVNVSKTDVNQDIATTSQSSLKENMLSQHADNQKKAFYIGNLDDIFDTDFDDIERHQKSPCSGKKTDEEDIIASSQSVIFKSKPLNTFKNYESDCKSTLTKFAFPKGDDMFASFSTTSSSITSPSTLKKITPSTIQPDHSIPARKPIGPDVPSNSTTKLKKTPTSTSRIDRSPSMFNRKVNLSRLLSKSQTNRSNCLPNKSPLFHSCGNLVNEDNNNDRLLSLEADAKDCASQIGKDFKIHRNAKRNYVIDDTIPALSQEKDGPMPNIVVERIFKKPRKPFRKCNFIQDECDASDGSTDEDENISDFIGDSIICNDDDVHDDTAVDMKAIYLQSTKSPVKKNGFRLPNPTKYLQNANIFSQTVVQDDDSDYDESFVVNENEEDEEVEQEMTVLERAELILKMRRKEKRKGSKNILVSAPKRRKIIVAEDSSDENE